MKDRNFSGRQFHWAILSTPEKRHTLSVEHKVVLSSDRKSGDEIIYALHLHRNKDSSYGKNPTDQVDYNLNASCVYHFQH